MTKPQIKVFKDYFVTLYFLIQNTVDLSEQFDQLAKVNLRVLILFQPPQQHPSSLDGNKR